VTASGSGPTTAAKQTGAPADTPIDTRAHLAWATLYELQPKPRDPEELFSTLAISRRGRFGPWPRDEDDRHVIDSVFAALK
jgi:hypothetical protein